MKKKVNWLSSQLELKNTLSEPQIWIVSEVVIMGENIVKKNG